MNKWLKYISIVVIVLFIGLTLLIFGSYYWIEYSVENQLTSDIYKIKSQKTAIVLGTAKRVPGGAMNLFFRYRMDAVKSLFNHKKIKYVIVSGDNGLKEYNEPKYMKNHLIKLGIPKYKIIADFAGFRTLDSVVRSKEVFGQDSIIIISQPFHNARAVFIANHYGLKAQGFNAKEVRPKYGFKTHMREYLARVKCILDVYILNTMPKYYKEKEQFPD